MVLTLHERIFVTEQYFAHTLYKTVSEMFQAKFPGKDMPNKSTISRIIAKFCQHGTVCNLPHDKEKTALTPRVLATVSYELAPNDSGTSKSLCQVIRKHRNQVLSYGTAYCATEALGLHPYRVCVVHELLPLDYNHRVIYCQWLLNFVQARPTMLNDVFYSDEAWFQLSGYVNSPAPRHWKRILHVEINNIQTNVTGNVVRCARACISAAGGQFEHLL